MRSRFILVLIVADALGAASCFAQAVSGSINGYVTDPSEAPIANATVTVANEQTGIQTKTSSNASGFYNAINLPPGRYSVQSEHVGFSKFTRERVTVEVDATVRVDLKLSLGSVAESVTVAAGAELLQSEKVDVSQTLSQSQIESLPVVGRNITQLYSVIPGAVNDTFQMGAGENPAGTNRVYINGTWSGAQEFILDGITNRSYGFSGIQLIVPPEDSVQELKLTTADYDPEFGSTAGMVAQYVTKSGTNDIHGSLLYFNRNSATFAADPLTQKIAGTGKNGTGTGVAPFNWNQGGFSLGGPLKKNKLFLFGDYQLGRTIQGATIIATVPNDAFRSGDFSAVGGAHPIYDPLTGNPDGTGRTQFAGNRIPANRVSPVSQNLLNLLPRPNINQNTDNNFVGDVKERFNQNWTDQKGDWNIDDRNKFFARYSYFSSYLDNPPLFGRIAGGPAQGGLSAEAATSSAHQGALNYVHTFNPTFLAEFRAGLVRFVLNATQYDSALQTNNQVGLLGINTGTALTGGLAGINVGGSVGGFSMGIPSGVGIPRFDTETTLEFVNNWSKITGSHQLRWGVDVRRYRFDFESVNSSSRGNYTFCQTATADAGHPSSGLGAATLLLGGTCAFDRAIFTQMPAERQTNLGFYGQDIWRIGPRLTLNYGLRWDYFSPVTSPRKGGLANFDPGTGDILLAGLGNVSNSVNVTTPLGDFAPRLGLAYKVTRDTVVRAGFGRSFFSSGYDATFYHLTSFYPITAQQQVPQTNLYQAVFPIDQPVPAATPPALPSSGRLKAPNGTLLKARPFDWKTETMDSWNFTIEQALGHGATLAAAYVGSKGTHLSWAYNMNAANAGAGPLLNRRPYYQLYGLSQSINMECNCSDSNYHALQIVLNKQLSAWYTATSNFTWAKSLGYSTSNPYNRTLDYGPGGNTIGAIDRKFVWTTLHSFRIPYGPGLPFGSSPNAIKRFLLAGWVFSGVTTLQSGLAFSPSLSSNATLNGDFGQRPNRVSGVSLYDVPGGQSAALWYNRAAFASPVACCQVGNASVGMLRGPGEINADWSLSKEFAFKSILNRENTRVEFRAESYNTWNNTNLGLPNATVDSSAAGRITGLQLPMRRMQFGVHVNW
ncbi:MAG: TonB-dependent receptor domain-containing protein [Bryobacteraceae bacterium]